MGNSTSSEERANAAAILPRCERICDEVKSKMNWTQEELADHRAWISIRLGDAMIYTMAARETLHTVSKIINDHEAWMQMESHKIGTIDELVTDRGEPLLDQYQNIMSKIP